jgi:hypothetical protein
MNRHGEGDARHAATSSRCPAARLCGNGGAGLAAHAFSLLILHCCLPPDTNGM